MAKIPTKEELEDFALNFDKNIEQPLVRAGYDSCNIFDILNIKRQELKHSDFLAFLFDENKSGEIGKHFLRRFLIASAQKNKIPNVDVFDILYSTIKDVNVHREFSIENGRIDLLIDFEIINKKHPQKVVIAIENKIDSEQHDDQLNRYKTFLTTSEKYKYYNQQIKLYLTTDGSDSGNSEWASIDYELILDTLNEISTVVEKADNSIKILVDDYKKIIRSEFMNETEAKEKALEIYQNNREILDFIFECRPDWVKETSKILFNLIKAQTGFIPVTEKKRQIVEITENKGVRYLMFKPLKWIDNYPNHYFLIDVSNLSCEFRMNSTQKQPDTPTYYLFDDQTEKEIEELQKYALSNREQIETDCRVAINKMFEPNGIIQQWVDSLKSRGENM
ncbi:MAG: PD-(D/E)XK nuclease family protein [Clostridia bacterium]|nr:PD-(D/E)XK nuclease family protein [Clostridia bacterium]